MQKSFLPGEPGRTGSLWASILQDLTASRSSIVHAAEFALERSGQADELLAAVVARTQSCPPQLRMTSLYLIDAIFNLCAAASGSGIERGALLRVTVKWLPTILRHISGTEVVMAEGLAGRLCEIRKLVCSWEKKQLFEPALFERARKVLCETEAVAANAGVTGNGKAFRSKASGHERSGSFVGHDRTAKDGFGQLRHSTSHRTSGQAASPANSNSSLSLSPPHPLSDARSDVSLPSPPKTGAVAAAAAPTLRAAPHPPSSSSSSSAAAAAATTAGSNTRDGAARANGLCSVAASGGGSDDGARSRRIVAVRGEAPSSANAACAFLKACEVRGPPPTRRRNAEEPRRGRSVAGGLVGRAMGGTGWERQKKAGRRGEGA